MSRRHILTILMMGFLTLGVSALGQNSYAQEASSTSAAAPDDMDKIPDEYIEEAHRYFNQCQSDYQMSQYLNCECSSVAFLDERIKRGPTMPYGEIILHISSQCRDAVGAAGQAYQTCIRKASRFKPGTDPEKFCECVANRYVKNINEFSTNIDSRTIVRYQGLAYIQCQEFGGF